ncbi:MAG: hypothetical protein AB8G77_19865 [Rhodothermales bacterium]
MNCNQILPKVLLSTTAIGLAVLHITTQFKLDAIGLGLFGFAALPWLSSFLRKAELPGGMKIEFQEIKAEQARQARELDAIKFLMGNFLTVSEREHLQKISAATKEFMVKEDKTSSFFAAELRKLKALGFIRQRGEDGVRTLLQNDGRERNVCDYFEVTERGREFLQLHFEVAALGDKEVRP